MHNCNEEQISGHIHCTGNPDKRKRRPAVAEPAEDRGEQVVGNDKEDAAAADGKILLSHAQCFFGRLHEHGNGLVSEYESDKQDQRDNGIQRECCSEQIAQALGPFLAKVPADEHGHCHRGTGHDKGHEVHDLRASGNC